jgi:type VI secretion system Hcp family effector
VCVASSGAAQAEGYRAFVHIAGFKGSVVATGAQGSIPLLGFNSGFARVGPAGDKTVSEFAKHLSFDKALDLTTPLFYQALATDAPLQIEFWFFWESQKGALERVFTIAVDDAHVVGINSAGEATLRENVTVSFDAVRFRDDLTGRETGL